MVFAVINRISELTLLLMVCLAPWAFGSVEAWAELGLYAGIGLLIVLDFGSRSDCRAGGGRLVHLPSLALGGLVLLAVFQSMPLGSGVLSWIAPSSAALRTSLLPEQPEQVMDTPGPGVPFPAATLSVDPDLSLQTAARLAAAWLLFLRVSRMRNDPRVLVRFANVVVFNSVLLALFAIIQALTWNGRVYWVRPATVASPWSVGGPFLCHSHLAAYLNLGLGLALGLLLRGNSRDLLRRDSTNLWTALAAGIIAFGVVTSQSRSGFLGLLAASLALALFLRSRLLRMTPGLAVVLVIAGLFLALLGGSASYASRLSTIVDLGDQGYQARLEVWRGAIQAWWARPVWGAGLGVFPVAVTPYLECEHTGFFARAENEYFDMLVEGGAVGFLLILAFMVGMAGLARRAVQDARGRRERGFIAGAGFGLIALAIQSFADFGAHIPAVGVTAVVLCGMIARLARIERRNNVESFGTTAWLPSKLAWLGSVLVAAILIGHGLRDAWIEDRLAGVGLPLPGTLMATVGTMERSTWGLDEWRDALQDAVRRRPNWAEGYLRLGLVHLGQYRQKAKEWLEDSAVDPREIDRMAEPLWLLGAIHEEQALAAGPPAETDFFRFEPIRSHLLPAVSCFLEARRCCPFLALPHAELASLNYLLVHGGSASTYATRALSLSGNDVYLIEFLAQVAVQAGDRKLAARCWRKKLEVSPSSWPEVADEAALVLSADKLLSDVVADGGNTIRFADRLFAQGDQRHDRDHFFQIALERLALDREITAPERLFFEAHASAGLNLRGQACKRMEAALTLHPGQSAWREEYIGWLLQWECYVDVHRQALIGRYFSPDSQVIHAAIDRSAEALARAATEP